VLYEAPHRIERTLADLAEVCGPDRPVALARELTKLHEEVRRGTLGSIEVGQPRGEYVVVLGGAPHVSRPVDDDAIRAALRDELAAGSTRRDAVAAVSARLGAPRRLVYALATGAGDGGDADGTLRS
jgi:16S rRNA (cytidine1402-2'-O)-methyltransferase